ncbi:MAG: lysozyme inhibitor LprI family protein [Pseudomonadota bacterium]
MRWSTTTSATAAVILGSVVGPAPAAGGDGDTRLLEACLGNTPPDAHHLCIGNLSTACQSQPGGQTTVGMVDCIASEEQAWDRLLNSYWRDLQDLAVAIDAQNQSLGPEVPGASDSLLEAQRGWLKYRDGECAFRWLPYAGGTIRGPIAASCRLEMTARRVIEFYAALSQEP